MRCWALNCTLDNLTPHTNGQSKQTIQMLEDMLWSYMLDYERSLETYLPLLEFIYNNSYHASIDRPPFEMMYGRRRRTPICWGEVGHGVTGSIKVALETTELIQHGLVVLHIGWIFWMSLVISITLSMYLSYGNMSSMSVR